MFLTSNLQFDNSVFSDLKDVINSVSDKLETLKSFVPFELLPFVAAGLVISVLYLVLGRNND